MLPMRLWKTGIWSCLQESGAVRRIRVMTDNLPGRYIDCKPNERLKQTHSNHENDVASQANWFSYFSGDSVETVSF